MSESSLVHHRTIFDGWRSLSIALYLSLVGYGVTVGIPVISTAWSELLGFTDGQVGRIASADLGGLSFGSLLAAMLVARMDRRIIVLVAILVTVAANVLCIFTGEYEAVLILRLVAGIGSGLYLGVAIATLGATSWPARAYNIMLFLFAFTQAGELYALPMLSMNGIYIAFAVSNLLALAFLHWLPPRPLEKGLDVELDVVDEGGTHHIEHKHVPVWIPWLGLATIAAVYVNIGAYWTYIEMASAGSSADPDWVSAALIWASLFTIVACLVATRISNKFGLARPMLVTFVIQAVIVGMLALGINNINITISLFAFNFLWVFVDVYLSAYIANLDHSGRFAALIPGALGVGQIIGPNIAAVQLDMGLSYASVFIMCAIASLVAMAIFGYMYGQLKRRIPELADAS